MVVLPTVPGVIKSKLIFNMGATGNVSTHLFHHYTSAAPTSADLTTWAGAIMASWVADMLAQQPNNVILTEVDSEDLANPATVPGSAIASHAGSYPTSAMTAETACLINFHIARRYRGGKPRLYLPLGVGAELNTPIQWQSTFVSAVQSAFTTFAGSLIGVGPPGPTCDYLANVSYYSGKVLRVTPVVDKILSWTVNPIPASQRRRMAR